MTEIKPDDRDLPRRPTTEPSLRAPTLPGAERKAPNTDQRLRLDGEEDTLYEDGLELEDNSRPLTGIDGQDDSNPRTKPLAR